MPLPLDLLTGNGTVHAMTSNISANGILFTGLDLPEINSHVEFTINMPGAIMGTQEDVAVHCLGRIVRHQQHGGESQAAAIIDEYFMRV